MSDSVVNIATNAILPVDLRKTQLVFGNAEYVTVEVLVSALVRKFMKAPKSWTSLIMIHTLSLPLMGGAQGFVGPIRSVDGRFDLHALFTDGAKGIPAVLLAQWVLNTFYKGIHFPWFTMRELMITAGAKILTRPIAGSVYKYLPTTLQDGQLMLNEVIKRQQAVSTFNGDRQ